MSEYMFGVGQGKLSAKVRNRADRIARKHGAYLVTYTGPECRCGKGCPGCNHTYWFAAPNRGAPFDQQVETEVLEALIDAGVMPWAEEASDGH